MERSLAILTSVADENNRARSWASAGFCYRVMGDRSRTAGRPWYDKTRDVLSRATRIDQAHVEQARIAAAADGRTPAAPSTELACLELGRVYRRLDEPQKALEILTYGARLRGDASIIRELGDLRRQMAYAAAGR
jgi:hypothetical protein